MEKEQIEISYSSDYNIYVGGVEDLNDEMTKEIEGAPRKKEFKNLYEIGSVGNYIADENLFSMPIDMETLEEPERGDNFTVSLLSVEPKEGYGGSSSSSYYYEAILNSKLQSVRCYLSLEDVQYIFRYEKEPEDFSKIVDVESVEGWIKGNGNILESGLRKVAFLDFGLDRFPREDVRKVLEDIYGIPIMHIGLDFTMENLDFIIENIEKSPSDMMYKFGIGLALSKKGMELVAGDPSKEELVIESMIRYCAKVLDGTGLSHGSDAYVLQEIYDIVSKDDEKRQRMEDLIHMYWGEADLEIVSALRNKRGYTKKD